VPEDKATELKIAAANFAADQVQNGMKVGLGTGSTAYHLVEALGRRVASGLKIIGVPTSERTVNQARGLGIPLSDLGEYPRLDMTIDGADEVATGSLHLLKGLGGALLREKIVAAASSKLIIIVDESKIVKHLGSKSVVPVEVVPFGWQAAAKRVEALGCTPVLRMTPEGSPYLTDGSHYILDCAFGPIPDAEKLDRELNCTVGVVEHGMFLGMTSMVIIGKATGIETMHP
jgi:ribose 5-phosphate isomerase A